MLFDESAIRALIFPYGDCPNVREDSDAYRRADDHPSFEFATIMSDLPLDYVSRSLEIKRCQKLRSVRISNRKQRAK